MENKRHYLGKKRETILWSIRILAVALALLFAFIGMSSIKDFNDSMFFYFSKEMNEASCKSIIEYAGALSYVGYFRNHLYGVDVGIILVLFTMGWQSFYLRKKTKSYATLYRLPKGKSIKKEYLIKPLLVALGLYLFRVGLGIAAILQLTQYEGCELLIRELFKNIWRILL